MVRLPSASSTNMLSRHESAALALALAPVDMADPTWFPFDVDVVGERLQWLRLTEDLIEANAFLDPRMQAIELQQALTPLAPIAPLVPPEGAPAWLWTHPSVGPPCWPDCSMSSRTLQCCVSRWSCGDCRTAPMQGTIFVLG